MLHIDEVKEVYPLAPAGNVSRHEYARGERGFRPSVARDAQMFMLCRHARKASYLDTLAAVRVLRPIVNPNEGFRLQLQLLEESDWQLKPWAGWDLARYQSEAQRRAAEAAQAAAAEKVASAEEPLPASRHSP